MLQASQVEHFDQPALGGDEGDVVEPLVDVLVLLVEHRRRRPQRRHDTLHDQHLPGQRGDVAYRHERVLEVVEEAEAADHVEATQIADGGVLDVGHVEADLGAPSFRLGDVLGASVERCHSEAGLTEALREIAEAAACVQPRLVLSMRLELTQQLAYKPAAGGVEKLS